MERAIADRLIDDDVAITDLDIVQARRVGANPSLVLNGSSLATEIRKRYQITFTTFATGEMRFPRNRLLPSSLEVLSSGT